MFGVAASWTDHVVPSAFLTRPDLGLTAILVRVELDGQPQWLQLDTAVPEAVFGRTGPTRIEWLPSTEDAPVGVKAGSIGAGAMDGRWLVVDLADRRVAVLPEADPELEASTCWVPTRDLGGVAAVRIHGVGWARFDTGSAPSGIWTVSPGQFRELTGSSAETSPVIGTGAAFGKPVTIHALPASRSLHAGRLDLGRPRITWLPERRLSGPILGLQTFEGGIVVLDRIEGRLGRVGPCHVAHGTP